MIIFIALVTIKAVITFFFGIIAGAVVVITSLDFTVIGFIVVAGVATRAFAAYCLVLDCLDSIYGLYSPLSSFVVFILGNAFLCIHSLQLFNIFFSYIKIVMTFKLFAIHFCVNLLLLLICLANHL